MGENPFDILGVPFDADDAAVRRAYAKKVRQHPPETDPAGFQKVCDAFEAIRTAESRAALRSSLERPELAALMSGFYEAANRGDAAGAMRVLESVIVRFPDYTGARAEQIRFLAQNQRMSEAVAHARAWAAARPSELEPMFCLVDLHLGLEEVVAALEVAERARTMAPEDRRPCISLARVYMVQERYDRALEILDVAMHLPSTKVADSQVLGRRLLALAALSNFERIDADIERIASDEDRRAAAGMLTSLAGYVLMNGKPGRVVIAEKLFRKAGSIDPEHHRFELREPTDAKLELMRAEVQEHVAKMQAEKPDRVLPLAGRVTANELGGCLVAMVVAAIVGGLAHFVSRGEVAGPVVAAVVFIFGMLALFFRRPSGEFEFLELRPLDLIKVRGGTVEVIPLLRIVELDCVGGTVTLRLESGDSLAVEGLVTRVPDFVFAGNQQIHRLTQLAQDDLLETELDREPLRWDPA